MFRKNLFDDTIVKWVKFRVDSFHVSQSNMMLLLPLHVRNKADSAYERALEEAGPKAREFHKLLCEMEELGTDLYLYEHSFILSILPADTISRGRVREKIAQVFRKAYGLSVITIIHHELIYDDEFELSVAA